MTHAKSSITKLVHYIYIVVAMVLQGGMTVNAEEVVPEGAYDPATYKSQTYTVPSVGSSEELNSENTKFEEYIENHLFCCGDKIVFSETDETKTGFKHVFYIPDDREGHEFQALIDMGIIKVVIGKDGTNGPILESIEFIDKTKIVKLQKGSGSSGSGTDGNGKPYAQLKDSLSPQIVIASSISIDWDYLPISQDADQQLNMTEMNLPKSFYPIITKGKSYETKFEMPILKGSVPESISVNTSVIGRFIDGAFQNPVLDQKDFFENDNFSNGGFVVNYADISTGERFNYDESFKDYYNETGTDLKKVSGKYIFPVVTKAQFLVQYSNSVLNKYIVTFTYHAEGGKINGKDECTVLFLKSKLTDGSATVYSEKMGGNANYNLTYKVVEELAGEAKRDGYELVGWGHKDVTYPVDGLDQKAVSDGLFQSTCFYMEDGAKGNADFYAIWKKAEAKDDTTETKKDDKTEEKKDTKTDDTKTVKAPKVGTKKKDSSGNATYKVTKVSTTKKGKTVIEVAYVAPTAKTKKKTTIKIPSSVKLADGNTATVKSVASKAFIKNKKITKVVIPSTVTTIGKNAFANCTKLKTVTIKGTTLTKIETGAFQGCTSLKSFTIGKNVKSIGTNAFKNCKNLKKITVNTVKLKKTTVGKRAFKNISKKATFYVPKTITKKQQKNFNAGIQNGNVPKTVKVKKK